MKVPDSGKSRLISPTIELGNEAPQKHCVQFYLRMDNGLENSLHVDVTAKTVHEDPKHFTWSITDYGSLNFWWRWDMAQIEVDAREGNSFHTLNLQFEADVKYYEENGFLEVDDVLVMEGACIPMDCDFETDSCLWDNAVPAWEYVPPSLQWVAKSGNAPNYPTTGPEYDHTSNSEEGKPEDSSTQRP